MKPESNTLILTPHPSDLDVQLQELVKAHGLGAVGTSLTKQYGQTKIIAAALGHLGPDVTQRTDKKQQVKSCPKHC